MTNIHGTTMTAHELARALERARWHRKSPCEHGIVQHDEEGNSLPCAFPGCPCGISGRELVREVRPTAGTYEEWIQAQRRLSPSLNSVQLRTYTRLSLYDIPGFPGRLYLWVDPNKAKSMDLRRARLDRYTAPLTLRQTTLGRVQLCLVWVVNALFAERSWHQRRA